MRRAAYDRWQLDQTCRISLFFMNNSGLFYDKAVCLITTNTLL